MSDIVERLRAWDDPLCPIETLCREAADEIERLRADLIMRAIAARGAE